MVPGVSQTSLPRAVPRSDHPLLTPGRIAAWSGVLLAAECLTFLFFVAGTHGWIVKLAAPTTTDYVSSYAPGRRPAAGAPALAYDPVAHSLAEQAATAPGIPYVYFFYPPTFLLLCRWLAALPYLFSFIAFELVTGLAWLAGVACILGRPVRAWLLPCLAFPAVFWTVGLGQNAFLTASLFAFATAALERRPWTAGLLFGALCYKPHFGLLVPVALLSGRRWRSIAGAACSLVGLSLFSVAVFGWPVWPAFIRVFLASRTTFEAGRITLSHLVSPFGAVLLAGGTADLAYRVQAATSLFAAACVAWLWWRNDRPGLRQAALIAGTLLSIPVALTYDLVSAVIAAAWLLRDAMDQGRPERDAPLLAGLFLTPLAAPALGRMLHLQIAPFATLSLLLLCLRHRSTRRVAASSGLQPAAPLA